MKTRLGFVIALLLTFVFGIISASTFIHTKDAIIDANFLLTAVSAIGTLAGIAFAIYGWWSAKELPKLVEKRVNERLKHVEATLNEKLYKQQEASQKVIASYNIKDIDMQIELLNQAIEVDPSTYNAYIALGYAYWYGKKDLIKAVESFHKDLEFHPTNFQAACDLAALYASQKEWLSALSWMKEAIRINPKTVVYFDNDPRFDVLRAEKLIEYTQVTNTSPSL